MLQFELYSRNRRPVADFLAKNIKAAKNIKLKSASNVKDSKRRSVKLQAPVVKHTASRKKTELNTNIDVPSSSNGGSEGGVGGGTVVISKDYLDTLLKRSVMMHPGGRGGEEAKLTRAKDESQSHYCHHNSSTTDLSNTTNTMSPNTYQLSDTYPQEKLKDCTPQASILPTGRAIGGRNKQNLLSSPVTEVYFPFGRPGCGAPLRTASGHIMADLRGGGYNPHHPPTSIYHPNPLSSPTYCKTQGNEHLGQTSSIAGLTTNHSHIAMQPDPPLEGLKCGQVEDGSSSYARGPGPHVNQYTLNEKAEKRKKELEHKAFLKEQILAKERTKRLAKEKAEQEEKEEEIKFAREREKQKYEYNREKEKATRKEEESRRCQAMLQQAIEKAKEQAACAKMASRTAAAAATCVLPSTPHLSHTLSHEPSHDASNRRGSRIPVHSKYLASNKDNCMTSNTATAVMSQATALQQPQQQHQHGIAETTGQRAKVGGEGGARRRQQTIASKMKPFTTASTMSHSGDTKCWMRGEGYVSGTLSPPVPALARRMKNTKQHQHSVSIKTPPHSRTVMITQQVRSHNRTQVPMHHQNNTVAYDPPYVPMETRSFVDVGGRMMKSPPVPALRKKEKEKTVSMIQHRVQQSHNDRTRMNMGVAIIESCTSNSIPPVVKVSLNEGEKPHSHRQQVILQELAELRKGLMTHYSDVDHKLRTLLNNKNYSFLN